MMIGITKDEKVSGRLGELWFRVGHRVFFSTLGRNPTKALVERVPPGIYYSKGCVLMVLIVATAFQTFAHAQQALNFGPKVSDVLNRPPLEIKDGEDPIMRLRKERFNDALNEAKARFDLYRRGVRRLPGLIEVGERLFAAERDLYAKPEDQIRIMQRQLEVYDEAEENLEKQVQQGLSTQADLERLRYYKVSLEIRLLTVKTESTQPRPVPQPSPQ
jgi:hypothetical protein